MMKSPDEYHKDYPGYNPGKVLVLSGRSLVNGHKFLMEMDENWEKYAVLYSRDICTFEDGDH